MTRRATLRVAAALAALLVVIAFLHWAARFGLTGPRRWSGDDLRIWADDPVTVLATVARWIGLALGYYLLALVLLLAASTRSARLSRLVPRRVAGPVAAVLGITAVVVPLRLPDGGPVAGPSAPLRLEPASPRLVLEPLRAPRPGPDVPTVSTPGGWAGEPAEPRPDPAHRVATPVEEEWQVAPGESMWSIACDALVDAWDRPVADDEIGPYWRRLIEANEDRLIEPTNPDLILPGQRFVLPPIPADPGRSESP